MAESRGVAILVGAGDAIGAAVARRFAKGGYTVCIGRRDASKSQGLVGELRAAGHNIHAFSVDTRQEAEVQKLFADVESNIGPIEVCLYKFERQQASAGHHGEAVLQGLGTGLLRRIPGRT
jgi:NAD(P)-dependent dehydrogenase (short-subunit alcohol dehydrogenase family)